MMYIYYYFRCGRKTFKIKRIAMVYSKLTIIIFLILMLFSCKSETKEAAIEESTNETTNESTIILDSKIEGNAYVLTKDINKKDEIVSEFEFLDKSFDKSSDNSLGKPLGKSLGKYYLVVYNPEIHKKSQVLISKELLGKDTFNDKNYIFIQHKVKEYADWEKKFLTYERTRNSFKIEVKSILTYYKDPNNVTVIASFSDLNLVVNYGKMLLDTESMNKAGVISSPKILLFSK